MTMMKISPAILRASPVYQDVLARALDALSKRGSVEWMKDLVTKANMVFVIDSLVNARRMPLLKDELEQTTGYRLLTVARPYFSTTAMIRTADFKNAKALGTASDDAQALLARYLPIGHGKRTAGWALADANNDVLVERDLVHATDKIQGQRKVLLAKATNAKAHGVLVPPTAQGLLPLANGGSSSPI